MLYGKYKTSSVIKVSKINKSVTELGSLLVLVTLQCDNVTFFKF